mgnify:CR=1 FL=1
MKPTRLFLFLAVAVLLGACAPKIDADKFLIEGQVCNIPDSVVLNLCIYKNGMYSQIASDTIIDGYFSFTDTVSEVRQLCLLTHAKGFPNHILPIWVAPGELVRIKGEDKLHSTWIVTSRLIEQKDQNALQTCAIDIRKKYATLDAEEADILKGRLGRNHTDAESAKQLREKIYALREKSTPLRTQVYKAEIDYMSTIPRRRVWMETLVMYAKFAKLSPKYMPYSTELKALYETLPEELKQSEQGQLAYGHLYPVHPLEIGDDMVDATLYDIEGGEHHLAELKDRYILLDFWSKGCGPCRESIPELEEIAAAYAESLEVVSLSIDPKDEWVEYVREKNLTGHQWNELAAARTGLSTRYNVRGIPHYVLITPEGKVQAVWSGYAKGYLWQEIKRHIK